jgi:hypothetical protein
MSENYDNMPQEDMEYSIASQISYDYYDNGNDAQKTQEILDTYLEGYTFDSELSYNDASTIVRPDGTAILAYRGTRPTNPIDLVVDAGIVLGTGRSAIPAPSFIQAQHQYSLVKSKYDNVDITGHSRGGTWANFIARSNNEKAVVFNPGETPFGFNYTGENKTRVYRTDTFDLVSISTHAYKDYDDIRIIKQTDDRSSWLGSHNLTNFLPSLDMLPLSKEQEIFISPNILKEEQEIEQEILISPFILNDEKRQEKKIKIKKKYIEDVCVTDPYLFPERCLPKLKLKKQLNKN